MLRELQFNGEVVVVTGASTGIGRSTAEALAELGATTVLVARTQSRLDEVKAAIAKNGGRRKFSLQMWATRRRWGSCASSWPADGGA